LVFFGNHGDVVLEGVGDPEAFVADVGDALVVVPVGFVGEGFVDDVVEVFVLAVGRAVSGLWVPKGGRVEVGV